MATRIYDLPCYTPYVDRMLYRYYAGKAPRGPVEEFGRSCTETVVEGLSPTEMELMDALYTPPRGVLSDRLHDYQKKHPNIPLEECWRMLWKIQKRLARERGLID